MILGIGKKKVTMELVPAEHMYYMVRIHACPTGSVNQDHLQHMLEAITEAGGFQSEMEELLDILEARGVDPSKAFG